MQDLYMALQSEVKAMKASVRDVRKAGLAKAKAEADYQRAKASTALALKADGYPATMIQMILKGDERVSDALFARDCAEVLYEAEVTAHNAHKLNARFIEAQIEREWAQERRL